MGESHCCYMVQTQGKSPIKGPGLSGIEPRCYFAIDFGESGQGSHTKLTSIWPGSHVLKEGLQKLIS